MKIKEGFELRDICGEKAIMGVGMDHIDFSKIISVNESAAYLWQAVLGKDFEVSTLTDLLCQQYEVSPETAQADAAALAAAWKDCGIVE